MENNFLQTQEHCLNCHLDYFGKHICCNHPTACQRCNRKKIILDELNNQNKWKFCPNCGYKL
jgi:hypothetical protein